MVSQRGVTVVSVIHQPRKVIFDLFDSLVLLGVGGCMVYHGPVDRSLEYFQDLNYALPAGESLADFIIDISSGQVAPATGIGETKRGEAKLQADIDTKQRRASKRNSKKKKKGQTKDTVDSPSGDRKSDVKDTNHSGSTTLQDDNCPRSATVAPTASSGDTYEEEKARRAWLYDMWNQHMTALDEGEKEIYGVPSASALPKPGQRQSFLSQSYYQTRRAFLLSWRNLPRKLIDTTLLVVATFIIAISSGLPVMTAARNPSLDFETMVNPSQDDLPKIFTELFKYAGLSQAG